MSLKIKKEIAKTFGFEKKYSFQSDKVASKSKKLIASINNVSLQFELNKYRTNGVRDLFIQFVKSPMTYFTKSPKLFSVLDDISFDIEDGDRIGIIGTNGAGKTTLCRCITNMIKPTAGSIAVNGTVRFIFNTSMGVLPMLTGRENIVLLVHLIYSDLSESLKKEIIEDSIQFSELGHFIDAPFRTYSKGMQSRLCLSVISAQSSDLLILDEVFDGADEYFKEKVSKRIVSIIDNSGAIIFISHNREQIYSTCNRLIVLEKSKIVYDGNVNDGFKVYSNIVKRNGL